MRRRAAAALLTVAATLAACRATPGPTVRPTPTLRPAPGTPAALAGSQAPASPSPSAAPAAADAPGVKVGATGWRSNHGLWSMATVWARFTNNGTATGRPPDGLFVPSATYKVLDRHGVTSRPGASGRLCRR